MCVCLFPSRRRHTRCALVTGVQTCALPISERLDLGSAQMAQYGARLAAEAASLSLFAGTRVIRLEIVGSGDDCLAAVDTLLAADTAINPVIATGASVTAKSKLVKLIEGSDHAVAAICYQPDRHALLGIALAAAEEPAEPRHGQE